MKVVFDTNILVSAFVTPGGRGEEALLRTVSGTDRLVISKPIILELLSVLSSKFDREPEELARVALFLANLGEVVEPEHRVEVLSDEPDNRILECAQAGDVDLIVTGDRAMLSLRSFEGIAIRTLADYVDKAEPP